MNLQNFQEENGISLITKIIRNTAIEMTMVQPLNLKQKSLNHFCVIT